MTLYLGCWYLFWYAWKEETLSILWYQLDVSGGFIFKFTRGGNHPPPPLVRRVTKKGLVSMVRQGLIQSHVY